MFQLLKKKKGQTFDRGDLKSNFDINEESPILQLSIKY